jgi:hypothetical protein
VRLVQVRGTPNWVEAVTEGGGFFADVFLLGAS